MSVERNLKLNRYRIKDQGIYTMILLFYLLLLSGMAFFFAYYHIQYYLSITVYRMIHLFTPLISLLWILPIIGERIDSKWGELFCSLKSDTIFQIVYRNLVLDIILLIPFYFFSQVYGNSTTVYIQLILLNVYIQCIGITVYHLSDTAYTAYGVPLFYACYTIYTLLDSENHSNLAYVNFKELSMREFLYIHGWKIFLMVIAAVFSAKHVKR